MINVLLANFSTRVPPSLLRRLEALRQRRARRLGRRVTVQDLAREALEKLLAEETNKRRAA